MRIQERACGGFVLIRLALVDDHELVREGLVALLEGDSSLGIRIVYSGKDVGEAVRAHADVALLDIDLGPRFSINELREMLFVFPLHLLPFFLEKTVGGERS